MKRRQLYWLRASFSFLCFVFLGYMVKFYPEQLVFFDSPIQTTIRGDLPTLLTSFFSRLTVIGNPEVQLVTVVILTLGFLWKKWRAEAIWVAFSGISAGLLILILKHIYARPRPSLLHLVEAGGFSFPSGHALGSMLIFGAVLVVFYQRFSNPTIKFLTIFALTSLIILIGLSRIYLGVHYPSDVLAGFVLGYGILNLAYPYYDQKRFEWRFQSKQK